MTTRKYKISFDCSKDVVGTVMSALVTEVEPPTVAPCADNADRFKFTAALMQEQIPKVTALIIADIERLVIAPLGQMHPEERALIGKHAGPKLVYDESRVTIIPPMVQPRKRGVGDNLVGGTRLGQLVLAVFEGAQGRIKHFPDFQDAAVAAGYAATSMGATLSRMVNEGTLVKCGRGAYRLPTDLEVIEFRKKQAGVS